MTRPSILALMSLIAAGAASAAEQPVRSRLCPEDLPEGVRLPPHPGCDATAQKPATPNRRGVYELGDGTTVQIGGRVSTTFGARH